MPLAKMRVVLADDQPMMREGLRISFERAGDFAVVAEASDSTEATLAIQVSRPDALVIGAGLPHLHALDIIRRARVLLPSLRVLVTFPEHEAEEAPSYLAAGAQACLARKSAPSEFLHALRAVAQGGIYLSQPLAGAFMAGRREIATGDLYGLTERETEVLHFISCGFSNKEIARRFALSVRTVETHRLNIRRKTGAARLRDLVHAARQLGLDRPESSASEPAQHGSAFRHLRSV